MSFLIGPTRQIIQQDPDDILDYFVDLSDWLGGGAISTAAVFATGVTASVAVNVNAVDLGDYGSVPGGRSVTITVSGGAPAVPAVITLRVATQSGNSFDLTYTVVIKSR